MLLAGDIGGTKTVLALFDNERAAAGLPFTPVVEAQFPSHKYDSLEAIVTEFLDEQRQNGRFTQLDAASFGVAGPVVQGRAQITNLPWIIETADLIATLQTEQVTLLNDLESIANAVPYLEGEDDLAPINQGVANPHGAMGVIAPGTGLGEAFLVWEGDRYEAHPSEGGHASFAPTTPEQCDLLKYLQQRLPHVSFERVCSGSGIPNLYRFLRDSGRHEEPAWLADELGAVEDPTPTIVQAATAGKADICVATLTLFIEILAGEAANMALKVLATGGIYLGGGIPPRILPQLQTSNFMDVFAHKGRFAKLLSNIPIYVIRNPRVALYGAAYHGLKTVRASAQTTAVSPK